MFEKRMSFFLEDTRARVQRNSVIVENTNGYDPPVR